MKPSLRWLSLSVVFSLSVGLAPACGQADNSLFESTGGDASGGADAVAGSTGGTLAALGSGGAGLVSIDNLPLLPTGGRFNNASAAGGGPNGSSGGNSLIGSGGLTSVGGSPPGSNASGGRPNAVKGPVGARCNSETDCEDRLICLTSGSTALDGGGPAEGLCTADCSEDARLCQQLNAKSVCVGSEKQAYCFEACAVGSPIGNAAKCSNRPEMACTLLDAPSNLAACLPQCNGASGECESGTSCDFATAILSAGLCRAEPPPGLPTGSKCDPNAKVDPCRGLCLPFTNTIGACADGCTVGAEGSCNPTGSPTLSAVCVPARTGEGQGDAGICLKLCDCTADCGHPEMKCFGAANVASALGRKGVCDVSRPNDPPDVTASIIDTCGG
ncbi:MAG: hypothetical protein SFV15_16875 [Polyangiaceae bacterium]|nr:hypothetical protein [Polyangiaceae bacterium]